MWLAGWVYEVECTHTYTYTHTRAHTHAQVYIADKLGMPEGSKPVYFVFHGGSGSDITDIKRAIKVCVRVCVCVCRVWFGY